MQQNEAPLVDEIIEVPARATPRPAIWRDVSEQDWHNWKWQLSHRLNSLAELEALIHLTPEEIEGISAKNIFRLEITPYFASLIDPDDPLCPIRKQVIPTSHELTGFESMMADSLAEEAHSPVPGLVHRYPDRVLMLVTTECASYCRYCTRSRIVGDPSAQFARADYARQIDYIAQHSEVRDVLLSGGDPLLLPEALLENILRQLRKIPHLEIIRIGTRVPVFLPSRINKKLTDMLKQFHPLWMNIHFNHPKEITPEVEQSLSLLADAGIPLGAQTVLLAGINDCSNVMIELSHKLVQNRVRPYYLYQCDLVKGAGHFRTPISKGIEIIESMRGHTSGYAIPTYVVDLPNGGGKVPVSPQYLISQAPGKAILRNYEGFITVYTEPEHYRYHDPETCSVCKQKKHNAKTHHTIAGLLQGEDGSIKHLSEIID
jgi:lysine 2,3-aminomutase